MQSRANAVCWRAASWTFLGLVALGFVVSVVAGS